MYPILSIIMNALRNLKMRLGHNNVESSKESDSEAVSHHTGDGQKRKRTKMSEGIENESKAEYEQKSKRPKMTEAIVSDSEQKPKNKCEAVKEQQSKSESDAKNANMMIGTFSTDKDGHIKCVPGQRLQKYEVLRGILGQGAFGRVLRVKNIVTGENEVLKVAKATARIMQAAKYEVKAYSSISALDPNKDSFCIHMKEWFLVGRHVCIALPLMGASVYDFIKDNNFEPFPMDQVRHVSFQLCSAVEFLHKNKMIHTDIKPENIMFVNASYTVTGVKIFEGQRVEVRRINRTDIRLIDFGNLVCEGEVHDTTIQTAYYRAPEVVLELGWTYPCDIWSVACTIYEMYSVDVLFQSEENLELLYLMEKCLGRIPLRMINKTRKKYFSNGVVNFNWAEADQGIIQYSKPLEQMKRSDSEDDDELFDLIWKMLQFEPAKRISSKDAMAHPFLERVPAHQRRNDSNRRE